MQLHILCSFVKEMLTLLFRSNIKAKLENRLFKKLMLLMLGTTFTGVTLPNSSV